MKVLLPVDGSEYTKRMLAYIAAHEEMFHGPAEYIFATVTPPVPAPVAFVVPQDAVQEVDHRHAAAILSHVLAFARQKGWKTRDLHLVGNTAEAIAALADKEKPDLIVMGSHGHGALAGLVLGSVATGVLTRCKVPVLIVR